MARRKPTQFGVSRAQTVDLTRALVKAGILPKSALQAAMAARKLENRPKTVRWA